MGDSAKRSNANGHEVRYQETEGDDRRKKRSDEWRQKRQREGHHLPAWMVYARWLLALGFQSKQVIESNVIMGSKFNDPSL
jgi:hypothetical protein